MESIDSIRSHLKTGHVIPAMPLALNNDGSWSERHQRALVRYYLDAGIGGIAVGVHSTQFEIRDPKHRLFEPVLGLCSRETDTWNPGGPSVIKIAGICGQTGQAVREAEIARRLGYHCGLLSLAGLNGASEDVMIEHSREVSETLPIIGFYLQPAVGGRELSYGFWRRFAEIENVVAIKIAPFNRYATNEVIRAVIDSGRSGSISLYTGNDDFIVADLLTEFEFGGHAVRIVGGLLGQWGVWTRKAVELLDEVRETVEKENFDSKWLTLNAQVTDANGVVFDAANRFRGCIPGILEILRRQGLVPSSRCLNPDEKLSPGQAGELDRIQKAYPHLIDDEFVAGNINRWLDS